MTGAERNRLYRARHPELRPQWAATALRHYYKDVDESRRKMRAANVRNRQQRQANRSDPAVLKQERERVRSWRIRNPETNRLYGQAQQAVRTAVRRGDLIKPDHCERCGQIQTRSLHAHHEDHSQALEVIWLCRACHGKRHRKEHLSCP